VLVEQGHSGEGFGADWAGVLLDGLVGLLVRPEVAAVCETAVAGVAMEGFFACVSPHMALKEPGSGECLSTHLTLAGQRVSPDVHLEGAVGGVGLVAALTGVGFDPQGCCAVKLSVLGQSGLGGVGFTTVCAAVPGLAGSAGAAGSAADTAGRG